MPQALNLKIDGMHCDACVRRVTNALSSLPGVTVTQVVVGHASVNYDAAEANPNTIARAVGDIGFEAVEAVGEKTSI